MALAVAAPAVAAAKRRVVLLPLAGKQADKAAALVERVLSERYELVAADEFEAAAEQLGAGSKDRDVARVAAEVQVDAIVSGGIRKVGRTWFLSLRVREGKTGRLVDEATIKLAGPKVDKRTAERIEEELFPLISQAEGPPKGARGRKRKPPPADEAPAADDGEGGEEAAAEEARPKRRARQEAETVDGDAEASPEAGAEAADAPAQAEDDDNPLRERRRKRPSDDDAPDADADAEREEDDAPAAGAVAPWLSAFVGASFSGRLFNFTSGDDTPSYSASPVPGIFVAAEAYPAALFAKRPSRLASAFGVGLTFDRVLFLNSKLDTAPGENIGTTQQSFNLDGLFRWSFGRKEPGATVRGMLGFGQLAFDIDELIVDGANAVKIPDVTYKYLDVGGGVRYPLGSTKLALFADLKFLKVLSLGQIDDQAQYGTGSAFGLDLAGGAEYRLTRVFQLRGQVGYTLFSHSFDGVGDQSLGGTVKSARDQYFGGLVTVGYVR